MQNIPSSTSEVENLLVLEQVARAHMSPLLWAALGGSDEQWSLRRNVAALRALPIVGGVADPAARADISTTIFGTALASPILVGPAPFSPSASSVYRGTSAVGAGLVLQEAFTIESVRPSGTGELLQQLYFHGHHRTKAMIARAVDHGARGIVLTVDVRSSTSREHLERTRVRFREESTLEAIACHVRARRQGFTPPPFDPDDIRPFASRHPEFSWSELTSVRRYTGVPLVLKGIMCAEDAVLALEHGADGIVVSNHGGRAQDRVPATIEVLPEIVAAVGDRLAVFVDGGFRSGLDVLKALACGARAVLVVRPIFWSLASLGESGPEHVLRILNRQLCEAMAARGCESLESVGRSLLPDQ